MHISVAGGLGALPAPIRIDGRGNFDQLDDLTVDDAPHLIDIRPALAFEFVHIGQTTHPAGRHYNGATDDARSGPQSPIESRFRQRAAFDAVPPGVPISPST